MKYRRFKSLPYNPDLLPYASKLRKAGILSEVLVWREIKNKRLLNLDFDRQKVIGNFIVDFYCAELLLVIEIDGITHEYKVDKDNERDEYLKSLGIYVCRISDTEVKQNLAGVLQLLESLCQELKNINKN